MKSHNKRSRKILFMLIMSVLLASSCSHSTAVNEQPTKTFITPTTLPTIVGTSTTPPTNEVIPTSTTQTIVKLELNQECIPIEKEMPEGLQLSGVWVRNEATPYLETVDGKTSYEVPFKGGGLFSSYKVSPDGEYLAYIDPYMDAARNSTEKLILRIINSSGYSLKMNYWTEDWQSIISWADDDTLVLSTSGNGIITLNPFTGEWKKFREPEWVASYSDHPDISSYSPTLEWVLAKSENKGLSLLDVQNGNVVWELNHSGSVIWSTDSTTLGIMSVDSLNIITRGNLSQTFDISNIKMGKYVDDSRFSPNNLKFGFTTFDDELFIINIRELKIDKLCSANNIPYFSNIVWSPDSRFIVLEMHESNYTEQYDLLVDTEQLRAYKLISGQYQHRLVWLAQP